MYRECPALLRALLARLRRFPGVDLWPSIPLSFVLLRSTVEAIERAGSTTVGACAARHASISASKDAALARLAGGDSEACDDSDKDIVSVTAVSPFGNGRVEVPTPVSGGAVDGVHMSAGAAATMSLCWVAAGVWST